LLFRDYLEVVPGALSLRLQLAEPHERVPFKLQLLLQSLEQQAASQAVGAGDQILAEVSPRLAECGLVVADLHWLSPRCVEAAQSADKLKVVVQAVLEPGEYAARAPYWDVAQVPEGAGVSASSPCANANANAGELRWQLLAACSDAAGTVLARETAWESSVKALQASWDAAQPGRALEAAKARGELLAGVSTRDPPAADEARHAARAAALLKADASGQILLPRCPVPSTEEERDLLDAFAGARVEEGKDAVVCSPTRKAHQKRFGEWMAQLKQQHAASFAPFTSRAPSKCG
jgi:hypothetical protein